MSLDSELLNWLVGDQGKISVEDLASRIQVLLSERPELAQNSGVKASLAYSGRIEGASTFEIAKDWTSRSNGELGSVDTTRLGRFLNNLVDSWKAGTLKTNFYTD